MIDSPDRIAAPVTKAASAVGATIITAGFDVGALASWAAFVYSSVLICEWVWKRILLPIGLRQGWLKKARVTTIKVNDEEPETP